MAKFSDLPYEIRTKIWKSTVEPRMVPVHVKYRQRVVDCTRVLDASKVKESYVASPVSVPKVQHICWESRSLNLYNKFCLSQDPEAAYIWVNFDVDIINIGKYDFNYFKTCGNSIRRLKFEANNTCEAWYHNDAKHLIFFTNLAQCFVLAEDGWEQWEDAFHEHYFSCKGDQLYIIDKQRARMMNFYEVEKWMEDDNRYARVDEVGLPPEMALLTMYANWREVR